MESSAHDQAPVEPGADAAQQTLFSRELGYPIALTLVGWLSVGLFIAGSLGDSSTVLGFGLTPFLVGYFLAELECLKNEPTRAELRAGEATGFPRICWIGIGCVPAFLVAFVMFDRGGGAGWGVALLGAVLVIWAAHISAGLVSERRREESIHKPGGFLFVSPFIRAIASRTRATQTREEELRRRVAPELESLLTLLAFGLSGFTLILGFLAVHRFGVQLSGGLASHTTVKRAASAYVAWHALDLVPLVDIPKTLHWRLERTFTDSWTVGFVLLGLRLFILVPVLRTAVKLWALRNAAGAND